MAVRIDATGDGFVKDEFIVPDYYQAFSCKGPDCRHPCCSGWGVTIPMKQYYNLLGMPADKKLREKLDRAFRPLLQPTPERYAEIAHDYRGECPLRLESGWCMLHARLGEDALPSVCRDYPRGVRTDFANEISCSNSCEKTLELLFANDAPIAFGRFAKPVRLPAQKVGRTAAERALYLKTRAYCFAILENRTFSLSTRILMVGRILHALEADRTVDLGSIDLSVPVADKDIPLTYRVLQNVSRWFAGQNHSIAEYCRDNESFYRDGDLKTKYETALGHFETVLPNHAILFEKMLVNNLFFRQFPFSDDGASFPDVFTGFAGTYLFVRFLAISMMRTKSTLTDFVDIMATTFRVISHTRFEHNVAVLLRDEDAADFATIAKLVQA
ncbi:MAG TPA: hypothetical protein DCR44_07070 [Acholeplasmatales bacterium]|nr:MAG: hypothetical protein A2Y16_02565 [Tenericutes bacterium GWF2_57_13]HAQ57135.1 hypothetical protein [Acholeplasmatales bacterium]